MTEFDKFAKDYDAVLSENVRIFGEDISYFADNKANFLAQLLHDEIEPKILDYGCGTGRLSIALKRMLPKARIDGFDVSEASLREVPEQLKQHGVFTSSLESIGAQYDLAVLAGVLHHIPVRQRQGLLQSVASRLRPGGYLVAIEHNPANPVTRKVVAECVFDKDAVLLRPGEAEFYLTALGFRAITRDYLLFFPRFLSLFRPLERLLTKCPAGAQYAVHGQKL